MTNWYIYDNQETVTDGFDPSWLFNEAYRYVIPHINRSSSRRTLISLEAGPYVGTIPLLNADNLYIIPRAGRESFSRMLFVVEGLEDAVKKEFDQFVNLGYTEAGNTPWSILLARPFLGKLRMIEKESLVKERETLSRQLRHVKGKVKIPNTLLGLARNADNPIQTYVRESTFQNIENRLLSTASAMLLAAGNLDNNQRQIALRWSRICRGNYITPHELTYIGTGIKSHKFTGSRSYYVPALIMAKLIVSQTGLSLDSSSYIEGEPILTNVAILFEKYIRTIIAKLLTPGGYLVEKNEQTPPSLFVDGTCKLKPDVVISRQGAVKLIADMKYKPSLTIDPSDYYQLCTYLDNFGITKGVLILPNLNQAETNLIRRETVRGNQIFELRLPLGYWDKAETALQDTITSLI